MNATMMRASLISAGFCAAMAWRAAGAAPAPADSTQISFHIEQQPLQEALTTFANQAGVQLLLDVKEVGAPTAAAPQLVGAYTREAALEKLLSSSGLVFKFVDSQTVIIRPAGNSGAAVSGAAHADTMIWRLAQAGGEAGAIGLGTAGEDAAGAQGGDGGRIETQLEEIVVTAQKRKEVLQDVPISMSVVSGVELDKSSAQGVTETLRRVPGVAVSEGVQGGGTQITIRGVTASAVLANGASPNAYYIDSVPFGFVRNAVAPDPSIYDLDRVEVLRGPQGTLYGAGGQGGVVRTLTHDANLDAFEWKARTSVSSTEEGGQSYRGDMAVNVPIIEDKLAVRAVLGYNDLTGWVDARYPTPYPADPSLAGTQVKSDINDTQLANARLKIQARPTENLTIGLSAWASRKDDGAPPVADDNAESASLIEQPIETDFTTYGLDIGYDFGAFSISSTTGYIDYSNEGDLDLAFGAPDRVSLLTALDSRVFSQEVLLSSVDGSPWQWSLGAFYRDAEDRAYQEFRFGTDPFPYTRLIDTSESYALFGELSRRFFHDQLKWTLGLRYFHDDGTTQGLLQDQTHTVYSATYEATTPRAVLTWTPSSDLSVYGSYSQGFRSGLYQNEAVTSVAPFYPPAEPDKLHNYELGAKGSLLNQRVSFEVALYYIDWKDVQQSISVVLLIPPGGNPVSGAALINGSSASGLGADFALTVRPARGLELGATVSWNDLTQDEAVINANGDQLFAAGDRLVNSPEYTASAFADYAFPIGGSGLEGRFSGSGNYTAAQDVILGTTRAPGEDLITAKASFSLEAAEHWTAMLYVDNLTNTDGDVIQSFVPTWTSRLRPRTVGLQLEYRW